MTDESDFNLRNLNDQELTEQVHDDLYNGLKDEVVEATRIFLDRGWSADKVLNDALVEGMRVVVMDFRDGILFVPEVLLAANAMTAGMEILRPLLAETDSEPIGKVVIGTVKGGIHNIGKDFVSMTLETDLRKSHIKRVSGTLLNEEFRNAMGVAVLGPPHPGAHSANSGPPVAIPGSACTMARPTRQM